MKLLLATTSAGKIREQRRVLAGLQLELVTLEDYPGIDEPEETGRTFEENARLKARYYYEATGLPSVGEDSGLEIEAFDGRPGLESARWLGKQTSYSVKNQRIIDDLAAISNAGRGARFVSAVALFESGAFTYEGVETCQGEIAIEPRGGGGFGYDPIFLATDLEMTLAEASVEEKDRVSHRGRSMLRLRRFLEARLEARTG